MKIVIKLRAQFIINMIMIVTMIKKNQAKSLQTYVENVTETLSTSFDVFVIISPEAFKSK
jgi:hypothetical protein